MLKGKENPIQLNTISPHFSYILINDLYFWNYENQDLIFGTNATERARVDGAGRVMLGTTTPGVADAHQLTIASPSSTGITIRGSTSGNGNVFFSDTTSGTGQYDGFIQYQHSSQALKFGTAASEKVRIDSSGHVGVGRTPFTAAPGYMMQLRGPGTQTFLHCSTSSHGDSYDDGMIFGSDTSAGYIVQRENNPIIISTNNNERLRVLAGGGLTFNGDTAQANALEDYEEGTFTPIFTSPGVTTPYVSSLFNSYSHQFGKYTKIGRHVIAEFYLQNANPVTYANGGANNQDLAITGLPFAHGGGNTFPSITVGWFSNWNGWSSGYTPMGYIENGTSYIRMRYADSNGISNILSNNVGSNSAGILVQVSYTTTT